MEDFMPDTLLDDLLRNLKNENQENLCNEIVNPSCNAQRRITCHKFNLNYSRKKMPCTCGPFGYICNMSFRDQQKWAKCHYNQTYDTFYNGYNVFRIFPLGSKGLED